MNETAGGFEPHHQHAAPFTPPTEGPTPMPRVAPQLAATVAGLAPPPATVPYAPRPGHSPQTDAPHLIARLGRLMRNAAPTIIDLSISARWTIDRVYDAAVEAESRGEVDLWDDSPFGPAVMLSSLSAGRLGLRIMVDYSRPKPRFRWVRDDVPEPRLAKATRAGGRTALETDLGSPLDTIGECSEDQGAYLDAIEACERGRLAPGALQWSAARGCYFTDGGLPWDGSDPEAEPEVRDPGPKDACPVCSGEPGTAMSYCARCDRSGVDALLPEVTKLPEGPKKRGPGRGKPDEAAGDATPTRKEIRRKRFAV